MNIKEIPRPRDVPKEEAERRRGAIQLYCLLHSNSDRPITQEEIFQGIFTLFTESQSGLEGIKSALPPPYSLDAPVGRPSKQMKTLGDLIPDNGPSTEDRALALVRQAEIEAFMDNSRLTPKQKRAVSLRFFDELPLIEIAKRMGSPHPQSADRLIKDGLTKMRNNPNRSKVFGLPESAK